MNQSSNNRVIMVLSLGMLALLFSGCMNQFNLKTPKEIVAMPWSNRIETPTRVTAVWQAVENDGTERNLRGFGGRVYFYRGIKEEPVKVDGTMAVYGFIEDGRDPNDPRPDKKFVISADQLPAHYQKTKLGHSYNIWIPWDKANNPQADVSLFVSFQPEDGKKIASTEASIILPGYDEKALAYISGNNAATVRRQGLGQGDVRTSVQGPPQQEVRQAGFQQSPDAGNFASQESRAGFYGTEEQPSQGQVDRAVHQLVDAGSGGAEASESRYADRTDTEAHRIRMRTTTIRRPSSFSERARMLDER